MLAPPQRACSASGVGRSFARFCCGAPTRGVRRRGSGPRPRKLPITLRRKDAGMLVTTVEAVVPSCWAACPGAFTSRGARTRAWRGSPPERAQRTAPLAAGDARRGSGWRDGDGAGLSKPAARAWQPSPQLRVASDRSRYRGSRDHDDCRRTRSRWLECAVERHFTNGMILKAVLRAEGCAPQRYVHQTGSAPPREAMGLSIPIRHDSSGANEVDDA